MVAIVKEGLAAITCLALVLPHQCPNFQLSLAITRSSSSTSSHVSKHVVQLALCSQNCSLYNIPCVSCLYLSRRPGILRWLDTRECCFISIRAPREDGHLAVGKLCVELTPCVILRASQATSGDSGYFLLSLMSSFVFRAVRDSASNPVSQERLVGAVLTVLAIADVSSTTDLRMQRAN
jgi:hypothetical protein